MIAILAVLAGSASAQDAPGTELPPAETPAPVPAPAEAPAPAAEPTQVDAVTTEATKNFDYDELVIVWPDKFARWKKTRWLITTEMVFPPSFTLSARENKSFQTVALQLRGVVSCDQDYELTNKKIEVGCTIEDISIQATSLRRFTTERDLALVQEVLDELDADLTGAIIQIQTRDRGEVVNIDLEGIDTRTRRERVRLETLRQLSGRMLYPFHMKLPKTGPRTGQWVEFNSALMTMPSSKGSAGSSTIVHYLNPYKGFLLVQDIGEGTVTGDPPVAPEGDRGPETKTEIADPDAAQNSSVQVIPDPVGYRLYMDGVSIYNLQTGVMEERVWSTTGKPYAAQFSTLPLWYTGRIQILGEDDHPDLGKSEQISYPGNPLPGLPVWKAVDPEIAKTLKSMPAIPKGGQSSFPASTHKK